MAGGGRRFACGCPRVARTETCWYPQPAPACCAARAAIAGVRCADAAVWMPSCSSVCRTRRARLPAPAGGPLHPPAPCAPLPVSHQLRPALELVLSLPTARSLPPHSCKRCLMLDGASLPTRGPSLDARAGAGSRASTLAGSPPSCSRSAPHTASAPTIHRQITSTRIAAVAIHPPSKTKRAPVIKGRGSSEMRGVHGSGSHNASESSSAGGRAPMRTAVPRGARRHV